MTGLPYARPSPSVGSLRFSSRETRGLRLRVVRMHAHDGALALLAIEGGVAAGDAAVVLVVADAVGQPQTLPQRRGTEGAIGPAPESPLWAVRARLTVAERDALGGELALERLEVGAGLHGQGSSEDMAAHVDWRRRQRVCMLRGLSSMPSL